MIPTRNLMIRLQERTTALYGAPDATFGTQLRHFVRWLESESIFATALATLPEPEQELEQWTSEHVRWNEGLALSPDENEAMGELWRVLRKVASEDDVGEAAFRFAVSLIHGQGIGSEGYNRGFLEIVVDPILVWLKERLLKDDLVLHVLDRYAREAAWFRRDELRQAYEADTGRGEATLERDLRHALFRDGIDFPFSQVPVPTGRPDVVLTDIEAEPIPLEVKVFDPDRNRDAKWVISGFAQAVEYGHDFRRSDSYLAVFDVSTDGLALEGDDPSSRVPFTRATGVTVFLVLVPIGAARPASSRKRAKRHVIKSSDFASAD